MFHYPKNVRKAFSIALIIVLFLNVIGYYGVFLGLKYKNNREMTQRLDADDYDVSETITIKIPITIPYATDSRDFERVNGEFEHNGEFYRLVKQRLSRDTLYIVCIKDDQSKHINEALGSYVKTFTDKPGDSRHNAKPLFEFIKEYLPHSFSLSEGSEGWESDIKETSFFNLFISDYSPSIVHPPERA